jgi:hypothetical protein
MLTGTCVMVAKLNLLVRITTFQFMLNHRISNVTYSFRSMCFAGILDLNVSVCLNDELCIGATDASLAVRTKLFTDDTVDIVMKPGPILSALLPNQTSVSGIQLQKFCAF